MCSSRAEAHFNSNEVLGLSSENNFLLSVRGFVSCLRARFTADQITGYHVISFTIKFKKQLEIEPMMKIKKL